MNSYINLLKWFIREEWRFFTSLFGEKRFIAFPLIIFVLALIIGASSPVISTQTEYLPIVYFSLIILFGLQTGAVGFDAKDSIKNLLGDTSRILFASKTLPIKKHTLVSLFILKDAIFYSIIFLAPITLGIYLGLFISPIESTQFITNVFTIPILYISTIISFIFGVSLGFVFTTIRLERISGIIFTSLLLLTAYVFFTSNLFRLNLISEISLINWMIGFAVCSVLFIMIGLIQFTKIEKIDTKYKFKNRYNNLDKYFTDKSSYPKIMFKSLIDIQRSAGGFLKIIFSVLTIVLTSFVLIYFMNEFFELAPLHSFIYAGLFSFIAYPLYTICFRYDSIDTYSTLPISDVDIYKSKLLLFSIIGVPIGIILYTIFVVSSVSMIEYIQGIILFTCLLYYQFGLLMYLAKDKPMQFLFDGFLFTIYSISTLLFITPILIIGMYGLLFSDIIINSLFIYGVISGLVGSLLIYTTFSRK